MTVLVILTHTMMTYGGDGSWFYREVAMSRNPSSIFFTLFALTMQSFLMGFYFLIAGHFTPSSIDRHGVKHFLGHRTIRLGVPVLIFGFILGPFTVVLVDWANSGNFQASLISMWRQKRFINGPTWFDEALLIICFGYAVWRWIALRVLRHARPEKHRLYHAVSTNTQWFFWAVGAGIVAFLLRLRFPVDRQNYGLWIGYFSSYLVLFAAGVVSWRGRWFIQLTWKQARPWVITTILVWPTLPIAYAWVRTRHQIPAFSGGYNWQALLYAFWEPFVAWGFIATGIVVFRNWLNKPFALGQWMSRRAYATYILHSPVLVAVCLLLRNWHAGPGLKCLVAAPIACVATWLIADPLVRIPRVRDFV